MSRFYGSVQGHRGEATREGHKSITAHPRGWDLGVKVHGYPDDDAGGGDAFDISVSGGSHGGRSPVLLAQVAEVKDYPGLTATGFVRVRLYQDQDGEGSTFYLDANGGAHSRPHDADADIACACKRAPATV